VVIESVGTHVPIPIQNLTCFGLLVYWLLKLFYSAKKRNLTRKSSLLLMLLPHGHNICYSCQELKEAQKWSVINFVPNLMKIHQSVKKLFGWTDTWAE